MPPKEIASPELAAGRDASIIPRFVFAVSSALLVTAALPAASQIVPKSQLGTVSQQVAGTRIEIVYRRPVARGRALFGDLVPWNRIWTPSADSAARITINAPIDVNGSLLPAGSYSIWAIPDSSSWTVIFNHQAAAFHLRYPTGQDVLRIKAMPVRGEHVETLLWEFPMVDADSALLQLRWGSVVVPLHLRARATH